MSDETLRQELLAIIGYAGDYAKGQAFVDIEQDELDDIVTNLVGFVRTREKQWVEQVGRLKIDLHFALLPQRQRLESRVAVYKDLFESECARNARLEKQIAAYRRLYRLILQPDTRLIWELLRTNQFNEDILQHVPPEFRLWIQRVRSDFLQRYESIRQSALLLYEQVKEMPTRKEQALIVTRSPYASIIFRMLDGKDYAKLIWEQLRPSTPEESMTKKQNT